MKQKSSTSVWILASAIIAFIIIPIAPAAIYLNLTGFITMVKMSSELWKYLGAVFLYLLHVIHIFPHLDWNYRVVDWAGLIVFTCSSTYALRFRREL